MFRVKLAFLVMVSAAVLAAQTITGSITGTVTDPSGAVVANVKVVGTNVGTNLTFSATTNEAGVFNLVFLPVGRYTVSAEAAGFKKAVLGPFALEVNQIAKLDVKLEVGEVSQSVEITDVAPILQTESTQTGAALTAETVTSIPLNGRNFASLTLLIPGAISTSPGQMGTSARMMGSGSRPQVNGNREQTNNFLLDGIDNNDSIDNRIGYQPNVDALQEVKVITGNGSSEFGNVGGAIVNATLKSGTNQFHGNVFEFLRNDKLDANGFFSNRNRVARSPLRRNIYGGTFGGPVIRNKAFFFVAHRRSFRLPDQIQPNRAGPAHRAGCGIPYSISGQYYSHQSHCQSGRGQAVFEPGSLPSAQQCRHWHARRYQQLYRFAGQQAFEQAGRYQGRFPIIGQG